MARKNHTLLAMLAGAALAGGFLYAKKLNEEKAAEPVPEGEGTAPEGEKPEADYGWKATFTDENGEQVSADEATAEFKEEAVKALNEFKETAKVAGAEILAGLKKAFEEMKVAVADAQQAAAERRAQMAEEADKCEACEDIDEALEEVKDTAEDVKEEVEDKAEDIKEEVEDKVEDIKEAVEDKIEDVKDAFEDIKEAVEEKIEEIKD